MPILQNQKSKKNNTFPPTFNSIMSLVTPWGFRQPPFDTTPLPIKCLLKMGATQQIFFLKTSFGGGEGAPPAPKPNLVAVCESLTQSRASNGPLPNTLRPAPVLTTAGARAGSSRRPSRPEKTPPWTAATSRATPVGGTATPLCRAHTFMSPGRLVPAVVSGARAACSASKFGVMIVYASKLLMTF